jgi:hypothetical protein
MSVEGTVVTYRVRHGQDSLSGSRMVSVQDSMTQWLANVSSPGAPRGLKAAVG